TMDRCILLKGGTLWPADQPAQATSIVVTKGGGTINNAAGVTLMAGALLGPGVFTKLGLGTLVLSGTNNFSGTLQVSQGTVQLGASQTLAAASALQLAGGKLDAQDVTQSFGTPLYLRGISRLELNLSTQLAFADSSGVAWRSGILVLQGTLGVQGLRFGTSASGLTSAQCQQIRLGSAAGPTIELNAQGYVFNPKAVG
ncbi:MAG: autotransporter-associated beta strand repeat-containing protein, partial [Opitutales bacterium]